MTKKQKILALNEDQVAIVLSPVPEDEELISFELHRTEKDNEEADYSTAVALGMIGCAVYAPDLVTFMASVGDYTPSEGKKPDLKVVTMDGKAVEEDTNDNDT